MPLSPFKASAYSGVPPVSVKLSQRSIIGRSSEAAEQGKSGLTPGVKKIQWLNAYTGLAAFHFWAAYTKANLDVVGALAKFITSKTTAAVICLSGLRAFPHCMEQAAEADRRAAPEHLPILYRQFYN